MMNSPAALTNNLDATATRNDVVRSGLVALLRCPVLRNFAKSSKVFIPQSGPLAINLLMKCALCASLSPTVAMAFWISWCVRPPSERFLINPPNSIRGNGRAISL